LIAEDEQSFLKLLRANLEAAGYLVMEALDGVQAERLLREQPPDLLLLEWALACLPGIELLRRLRRRSETEMLPVIVLATRKHDAAERIRALNSGADDFVALPISVAEILARIKGLLRRAAPTRSFGVVKVGDIELDRDAMCARRRGKLLALSPTDFRILMFFLQSPGATHSRRDLIDGSWGSDREIQERTVDVYIARLRKALLKTWKSDPIRTVHDKGYRLDPT